MLHSKIDTISTGFMVVFLSCIFSGTAFSQENESLILEKKFKQLVQSSEQYVVSVISQADSTVKKINANLVDTTNDNTSIVVRKKVGSGFVVDTRGYIITRKSVVDGMNLVSVILHDGEAFGAQILGIDEQYEVALLKVNNLPVPTPRFAHDTSEQIGNWVVVIGNSLGFKPELSLGSVKAIFEHGILQISTKVYPGSIGAPVFNLKGQIVGILAARVTSNQNRQLSKIVSDDEVVVIPMGLLLPRISLIINESIASSGWIGMSVTPYPDNSKAYIYKVTFVYENSPAQEAGIQLGDQIITFNGEPIKDLRHIVNSIRSMNIDDKVEFGIKRADDTIYKEIQIGSKPKFYTLEHQQLQIFQQESSQEIAESPAPAVNQKMLMQRISELEGEIQSLRKLLKKQKLP